MSGVSQACVSKYLNDKPYVSKKTRIKIEKIIKKLNYKRSAIARSLVVKKTNCIGLLIRDITNPFYANIIKGMEEYIFKGNYNYSLILSDMIEPEKSSDSYIDTFLERRVDAIATTTDNLKISYLKLLENFNIPIIFVGRYIENPAIHINYITIDNFRGSYLITDHLIKLGHKNIAHFSVNIGSAVVKNRLIGYKTALNDNDIEIKDENIIFLNSLNAKSGYEAAKKLLSKKNRPSAIFCISDYTAYGVIDYCLKTNIKVPEDVSIAGFDDIGFSSLDFINLTTVRQPIKEIGMIATEILLNKIELGEGDEIHKIIEPELIIRKSTGYFSKSN